jgi:hypothetical protein
MDHLTQAVLDYQKTGKLAPRAKDEIMRMIYFYPSRKLGLEEELQADFFFFLEPKLDRLMRSFEYQEVPFGGYLASCLYWQSKSFLTHYGNQERLQAALDLNVQDFPYQEDFSTEVLSDLEKELREDRILTKAQKKRLIVIATKYIYYLRQDDMQVLTRITGMCLGFWDDLYKTAEETFKNRMEQLAELQEERGKALAKIHLLDQKIQRSQGIFEVAELGLQRSRLKNRIGAWNKRISRLHPVFTHQQVGSLLNIPKGSVDSVMHTLKKQPLTIFSLR